MTQLRVGFAISCLTFVIACGGGSATEQPYTPTLPTVWAPAVNNRFFPLVPGTSFTFVGAVAGGEEQTVVEVLPETKVIEGVTAVVVRDRVSLNGRLIEDTFDWYAQDAAGNVWYLGEDANDFENGRLVSSRGSWQWGVKGALPGIIMWADPAAHVGESYRQEYFKGEAEDWGKVIASNVTVQAGVGPLAGCVQTEDWSGIEANANEYKYYCPMVGQAASSKKNGAERHQLTRSVP